MMKLQAHESSLLSHEIISNQLESMLASPDFRATPQQAAFFKFVVSQTLAGNADQIKGYTVATEVFGRGPDFDQSIDPVVSIQAGRLRRAIERYYLTTGINDPARIGIPKGTYVPTFSEQLPSQQPMASEQAAAVSVMDTWPAVLVRPLANLTDNPADDYVSIGLTTELTHALSHYREFRVLEARHRQQESTPRQTDIDFIIDGSVRRDPAGITVAIRLCDARQCIQIWSGKYRGDLEAAKMISFQENVAAEAAVRVAGDNAAISKHIAGLSRNKAAPELTAYEAMLRFWESVSRPTPQSMLRAIRALEHAVAHEPHHGQTWSMLAAQYADNYGLEIIDLATPLEKAAEFAQRGVCLDPTNRRTRIILAYVRFMENRLPEARHEAETAYRLCPNSLMVLDGIGWLMALAGEWDRGVNWIKKAIELNPYYRPRVRQALFLNWFRAGNYEKAYRETFHFMMPEFYWDHLLKASVCGQLGKIEEGQTCVRALLALKPDFAQRGRILIGRYVKFENIADRIMEGLGKLGLNIES
jgi:adenylate cyclase